MGLLCEGWIWRFEAPGLSALRKIQTCATLTYLCGGYTQRELRAKGIARTLYGHIPETWSVHGWKF